MVVSVACFAAISTLFIVSTSLAAGDFWRLPLLMVRLTSVPSAAGCSRSLIRIVVCDIRVFAHSAAGDWSTGTVKLWSVDTLQPERTESGMPSLSHKGADVMQQELQSMEAKEPDTCYTTVQFTSRNVLLAAGYVNI